MASRDVPSRVETLDNAVDESAAGAFAPPGVDFGFRDFRAVGYRPGIGKPRWWTGCSSRPLADPAAHMRGSAGYDYRHCTEEERGGTE